MKDEGRYKICVSMLVIAGMVIAVFPPMGVLGEGDLPFYDIEIDSRGNYHKAFIANIVGNYEIYYTNDIGGQFPQDWNPPVKISNTTTDSLLLDLGIYLHTDTMFIIWAELYLNSSHFPYITSIDQTYYTISKDYGANWTEPRRSYEKIMLKYAEFDPLFEVPNVPPLPEVWMSPYTYYIVQMKTPMIQEWWDGIEAAGGIFYVYIPNNAYIIKMSPSVKEVVEALPYIRWIGIYHPMYKFSEELRDFVEGNRDPQTVSIDIMVFDNIDSVITQINDLGGIIDCRSDPYIRVTIDSRKLYEIAIIKDTHWMQALVIFTSFNDIAVNNNLMNVRATWSNPMYGLTGTGQIVAVADSGLDTGVNDATMHNDIQGRIVNIHSWAIDPWWDADVVNDGADDGAADLGSGHGTHVTGSVLGNGAQSAGLIQGVAYDARLIFQAVEQNTDWEATTGIPDGFYLTGIPTNLNTLFQQAYDEGARIHTNSWGATSTGQYFGPAGRQYELHSQNVDQFIWNNRDMTILFAAGNEGTDGNNDGIVDSQSISIPATAKNCITVGASENNRPAMINLDNDWDTRIDEDPVGDLNGDGWPGGARNDDDGDLGFDLNDFDTMLITPAQFQANPDNTAFVAWDDGINNDPWQDGNIDEANEFYFAYYDQNEDGIVTTAEIINVRGPDGIGGTPDDGPNDLNGIDDDLDGFGQPFQHTPPEWTNVIGDGVDYNDPELFDLIMDSHDFWSDGLMDNTIRWYNPANDDDEDGGNSEDTPDTYGGWWPNDFPQPPLFTDPMADNPQGMAAFSSRGNTADGRTKPDVVAPGTWILSTRSSQTTDEGWGRPELGGYNPALNPFYTFMGGTSMATPLTAGAAALVRQYYVNVQGIVPNSNTPSAALIKATLINGDTDITGQYIPDETGPIPNINEGWGRVDLTNSILPTPPRTMKYYDETNGLSNVGQINEYYVTDCLLTEPLKITLVWTDPPADPSASGIIVNDLDLRVTVEGSSDECYGNDFNTATGWSQWRTASSNIFDRVNNVENVYIQNPSNRRYKIEVIANTIDPGNSPQPYALVISYGQDTKTIRLYAEWNLVSLPLEPDRPFIKEVLRSIDGLYKAVDYYDVTIGRFKHYVPSKPDYMNNLWYLYPYMGFDIHIPPENIPPAGYLDLIVYGTHFSEDHFIEIYPGWNMVGYPSTENKLYDIALNNLLYP